VAHPFAQILAFKLEFFTFKPKGVGARVADLLRRPCRITANLFEIMKLRRNAKAGHNNAANPASQRPVGERPAGSRTIEHRIDWRKVREQLRRRDWPLNTYG
jgi:hypothetical protein